MDSRDRQRLHLEQATGWAQRAREVLGPLVERHAGRVHFRPSSRGVSLIGLLPDRPQRGRSGYTNLAKLSEEFDAQFAKHCEDVPQGRVTPEKQLQSWMLAEAYRNERHLQGLEDGSGDGCTMRFVCDELALPTVGALRIVCDLLAVSAYPNGDLRPAVVELKTAREMTRLKAQVHSYAECVDALAPAFESLFTACLGTSTRFTGPCERWIVWPMAGDEHDPREDELMDEQIRVVGYAATDDGYQFRVGRPAA